MTTFAVTVVLVALSVLLGEAALWKLLVRRLDPKIDVVDEDRFRTGLFPMGRIRTAAVCHAVALAVALVIPLFFLW